MRELEHLIERSVILATAPTIREFFLPRTMAGKNLVAAEKVAGVKHHLVLSIVGTDRALYIGYLRAKKEQENMIKASGIPYTIIRATQFHEHITTLIEVQSDEEAIHISTVDYQPIAAEDVAAFVTQLALESPKNTAVETAGPDLAPMTEFVSQYLSPQHPIPGICADDCCRWYARQ